MLLTEILRFCKYPLNQICYVILSFQITNKEIIKLFLYWIQGECVLFHQAPSNHLFNRNGVVPLRKWDIDFSLLWGSALNRSQKFPTNRIRINSWCKMEVMEEGDLMDRVPILLQRDRQYYDVIHKNWTISLLIEKLIDLKFISY